MASSNTVTLEMDLHGEDLVEARSSVSDTQFDTTVGHIEDIIMEDDFQTLQNKFMEKYYEEFEDTEENKFVYTDIHKKYTDLVEKYLQVELDKRIPGFCLEEFQTMLISRKEELEGEVFEMLLTFSDFLAFKEMMLDYRAEKEGRTVDLGLGLTVTSLGLSPSNHDAGLPAGPSFPRPTPSGEPVMAASHAAASSRLDCGEPMVEGTDTPKQSLDTAENGHQVVLQDDSEAMMESPR